MEWWWSLLSAMDAHEGQAAWAQAMGSVAAIGGAVWLLERQIREDRSKAGTERRDLLEAAISSGDAGIAAMKGFIDAADAAPLTGIDVLVWARALRWEANHASWLLTQHIRPVQAIRIFSFLAEDLNAAATTLENAQVSQSDPEIVKPIYADVATALSTVVRIKLEQQLRLGVQLRTYRV